MKLTKKVRDFLRSDRNQSIVCLEANISRQTLKRRKERPCNFRANEIEVLKRLTNEEQIFEVEEAKEVR